MAGYKQVSMISDNPTKDLSRFIVAIALYSAVSASAAESTQQNFARDLMNSVKDIRGPIMPCTTSNTCVPVGVGQQPIETQADCDTINLNFETILSTQSTWRDKVVELNTYAAFWSEETNQIYAAIVPDVMHELDREFKNHDIKYSYEAFEALTRSFLIVERDRILDTSKAGLISREELTSMLMPYLRTAQTYIYSSKILSTAEWWGWIGFTKDRLVDVYSICLMSQNNGYIANINEMLKSLSDEETDRIALFAKFKDLARKSGCRVRPDLDNQWIANSDMNKPIRQSIPVSTGDRPACHMGPVDVRL